ncbi:hypothetical protein INR49_018280, partial [Caranx melampygus]
MPQPGMNGMEPAFGEAYGGHRGLLSPYPLAMSPQGGRTDYDQSVLLMLGSPASPRKRPFELLSDLVDDGGFGEDLHPERWDVSALDEMARYTKLGLGVGGELLACSEEAVLMGRWGRSREEQEEEEEEEGRRGGGGAAADMWRLLHHPGSPGHRRRRCCCCGEGGGAHICCHDNAEGVMCRRKSSRGGQNGGCRGAHGGGVPGGTQEEEEEVAAAA